MTQTNIAGQECFRAARDREEARPAESATWLVQCLLLYSARMKAKAVRSGPTKTTKNVDPVDAFLSQLKHPLSDEIEALRVAIRGVSPAISEEIKWNAPGFRTTESFATVHLRSMDRLQIILHLGAKVRPDLKPFTIDDPTGLLKWLGKDRCMVTVGSVTSQRPALIAIIRQWIKHV